MLSKAHLTSHSRMSSSRWVITPLWLSGSWRSFLYSSVYSCHLFLISSASVLYWAHLCMKYFLDISNFLEEISQDLLKRVFPILLFSSISLHWLLRKAFLSLLAILWNSAFKWVYLSFSPLPFPFLLFSTICKGSSDNHFAFLHFFFLGMVLIAASCTLSQTSIHSSLGTLSELIIKKRWQEYTEELYKRDLHNPDNHDGVIIHLEPDILECEVKWALGSVTMNKAKLF